MADTYKKRTRAWDNIKATRRRVEKDVSAYHRARRALINLDADDEIMSMYKGGMCVAIINSYCGTDVTFHNPYSLQGQFFKSKGST